MSWYIGKDEDLFFEILKVYDRIILDILGLPGTEVLIATVLYQKPYETLSFIIG